MEKESTCPSPNHPSQNGDHEEHDLLPGIGFEFEANLISFKSHYSEMTSKQTNDCKGKTIRGRKGDLWRLMGDDTLETPGVLSAEYILDGLRIKLTTGAAAEAARQVAADLVNWNPRADAPDPQNRVEIETVELHKYNPFYISQPTTTTNLDQIEWARHVTAPMPLGAMYKLFRYSHSKDVGDHPLLALARHRRQRVVCVSTEYFQSHPEGINPMELSEDQLGFFSLVMSYVKACKYHKTNSSPKFVLPVMPRTNFVKMFRMTGLEQLCAEKSLYSIVQVVSCYETNAGQVVLDDSYCDSGSRLEAPLPNDKLGSEGFTVKDQTVLIKDWVQGLQSGKDKLSELDEKADSQIGGRAERTERVLGATKYAPIFEFRELGSSTRKTFVSDVVEAESCVVQLHLEALQEPN